MIKRFGPGAVVCVFVFASLAYACDPAQSGRGITGEAPFLGPSFQMVDETPGERPPAAVPLPTVAVSPPPDVIEAPPIDRILEEADRRREEWLNEPFRCKAISTTKLRRCRFEAHDGGHRLKFQVSDVVCQDVEFDEEGNPSRLLDCAGAWLRVPRDNTLQKARGQDTWSGSHRGWKWRDGSKYCCPGLWLEAPDSLPR